jgi:hypothetical protein
LFIYLPLSALFARICLRSFPLAFVVCFTFLVVLLVLVVAGICVFAFVFVAGWIRVATVVCGTLIGVWLFLLGN